jgi:glycosyltransferase involved in cell wall biosynthesis
MNILHIAPHLGGGVGKAHAAIGAALPKQVWRTFLLLEQPRDRQYIDAVEAQGARVIVTDGLDQVAEAAATADIVQFEFWNHPRLYECLARLPFPAMRSVFWSHISGLSAPVIQLGLMEQAGRFVFTTEASFSMRSVTMISASAAGKLAVINSGFGFAAAPGRTSRHDRRPGIAYLGTVDFAKMHPGFFGAIDALDGTDVRAAVWGDVEPSGEVVRTARAMRHPERVEFRGRTDAPAAALSAADIFFYPLQRRHYGTGENALVEAMSLGLVPVVLDNAVERSIVRHEQTGFVVRSIDECVAALRTLLTTARLMDRMSLNAARDIAEGRTPGRSAQQFMALWRSLLEEPKTAADFGPVVGGDPAAWFLATQCLPGEAYAVSERAEAGVLSKGTLAHFQSAFPGDPSWARLANGRRGLVFRSSTQRSAGGTRAQGL